MVTHIDGCNVFHEQGVCIAERETTAYFGYRYSQLYQGLLVGVLLIQRWFFIHYCLLIYNYSAYQYL